jgi:hypothetical protein
MRTESVVTTEREVQYKPDPVEVQYKPDPVFNLLHKRIHTINHTSNSDAFNYFSFFLFV